MAWRISEVTHHLPEVVYEPLLIAQ
jgi:hypothetical protein